AAGDDDARPFVESFGDGECAEVDTGAADAIADCGERLAGIDVAEFHALIDEPIDLGSDVVAGDCGYGDVCVLLFCHGLDGAAAGFGIESSGVGDEADVFRDEVGEEAIDYVYEIARVAGFGVAG